jgi:hypothetical protein
MANFRDLRAIPISVEPNAAWEAWGFNLRVTLVTFFLLLGPAFGGGVSSRGMLAAAGLEVDTALDQSSTSQMHFTLTRLHEPHAVLVPFMQIYFGHQSKQRRQH